MSSNNDSNIVSLKRQELSRYSSNYIKKGLDLVNKSQSIDSGLQPPQVITEEIKELLKCAKKYLDYIDKDRCWFREAFSNFNKAIQINPNCDEVYYQRGNARDQLGDYLGAVEDYTRALEINPNCAIAYKSRGYILCELKDYLGAVEDYTQVLQIEPDNSFVYYYRGYARVELGDYQGVIEDFTQVIQDDWLVRMFWNSYYLRGRARTEFRDYQNAIDDYTQYLDYDCTHGNSYYFRGSAYCKLGQYQSAINDFNQALDFRPDGSTSAGVFKEDDYYDDSDIYIVRGNVYYKLEEYQSAINDYSQALQIFPKNVEAYHGRSKARSALGDAQGALDDLREVILLQGSL